MTAPSWPQLAGWLATAELGPSRGTATLRFDANTPPVTCDFVHLPNQALRVDLPDGSVVLQDRGPTVTIAPDGSVRDGSSALAGELSLLLGERSSSWARSDFHLPAGEVTDVRIGGRLGWRVLLEAPQRKFGPLEMVVDDETGRRLREANHHPQATFERQLDRLELVDGLDGREFIHRGQRAQDAAIRSRQRTAERLALQESLPPVRYWPPGFAAERPWPPRGRGEEPYDPQLVQLHLPNRFTRDHSTVFLVRGPVDAPPADPPGPTPVLRWEAAGWAYAMTIDGRALDADQLRRVQASVVEREIDG